MSENKHFGRSFAGKGYYIALILCAAAIGITGYVYYQNEADTQQVLLEETEPLELPVGTLATEDVAVIATEPQGGDTAPAPSQPTAPTAKENFRVTAPVSGQEIFGYAMEVLSYNQTTRDWRVHNGVDFAAQEGTPVAAAADGTVCAAYEDDALGATVMIRHAQGYTTQYSSLQKDLSVKVGDKVSLGQTIGYAGSTALVESTLGSHVHFSVTHYDEAMDPAAFLALGQ